MHSFKKFPIWMFCGYDHKSKWATVGFNDSNKKIRFQFFQRKTNKHWDRQEGHEHSSSLCPQLMQNIYARVMTLNSFCLVFNAICQLHTVLCQALVTKFVSEHSSQNKHPIFEVANNKQKQINPKNQRTVYTSNHLEHLIIVFLRRLCLKSLWVNKQALNGWWTHKPTFNCAEMQFRSEYISFWNQHDRLRKYSFNDITPHLPDRNRFESNL